jgi:hypothetical protein
MATKIETMNILIRISAAALATVLGSMSAAGQLPARKSLTEELPQTSAPAARPSEGTTLTVERLASVLGIEVRTETDRNIGRIVDLLSNRSGQVEAAVIEFGGFLGMGTRKIAVEWSALRLENDGNKSVALLELNRDQLRSAPEFKSEQPVVVRKNSPLESPTPAPPEEPTTPPPSVK